MLSGGARPRLSEISGGGGLGPEIFCSIDMIQILELTKTLTPLQGDPYGLWTNQTILADYMSDAGYAVHGVGKWHLGFCSWDMTPCARGFDSFYGYYNGHETYYTHETHNFYDFR